VVPWHDEAIEQQWPEPQYDVELAKSLLAEAGLADGFECEAIIWNPEAERVAVPLQQELANIGITMSIQTYELATWLDFVNPGNFDCYIARWTGQDTSDPYAWLYLQFHSSMFGSAGNRARFSSPDIDALLDTAEGEPDQAARLAKYVEAAKALVLEFPQIPLFGTNAVAVWNPRVQGFAPDAMTSWSASVVRLWYPPYAEVWLSPES
jgi:peptide/nickel transport system substrate-binding protein